MSKRISAIAIAAVGIVFIVVAIARNLFAVGPAFESMIDDFRPWLTDDSIAALRTDVATLGDAVEEFQTSVAPAIAQRAGVDQAAFSEMMASGFPAVTTGMQVVPEAAPTFTGIIDLLDEQQGNFASADAIPTDNLPATTVPWGIALLGFVFIALGAYLWLASTRLSAIVSIVVAALVVVAAFVMTLPGKASDADDLNAALKPVYTEQMVTGAGQAVTAIGAMGQEMQTSMVPGLAQMLQISEAEVQGFLGQFPAVSAALAAMPESLPRFEGLVGTFDQNLDNYDTLRPVAFSPIIWIVIIGSVIVALAGFVALFGTKETVPLRSTPREKMLIDA